MPDKKKEEKTDTSSVGLAKKKDMSEKIGKLVIFIKIVIFVNVDFFYLGLKRRNTEDSDGFNYDPMHFIRSHSKNNDPADIQTQIWEVVFEPDPNCPEKTTSKVATCGGNSICIIDVNTGTVLMKYKHKELK